ncbi:hypothetical protein DFQ28_001183 [Apophysomyces sp. BC1034]|nr:hypothetical protein DFQ30_007514 [Apophysomyces sp. BC1015]KAG0182056.1 hypothetical protein DFQ29_006037 [Apophysomyces sp. BC1021]KAG0190977.1 hypothetical protein DFQ28_001183 [Apophysomyces sp. BC1034]
MAVDFLASDIVFPSDSNEPKLSASTSTKLPEPVDWALHDYYSTVLEKSFTPIHSLTDLCKLEPVMDDPVNEKTMWKCPPLFTHKQDDQALILVLSNTLKQPAFPSVTQQQDLRAALRGALDIVENDMQHNMQDNLSPIRQQQQQQQQTPLQEKMWTWKDDLFQTSFGLSGDQNDFDFAGGRMPSLAYHPISENPVLLDSSTTSRLSSLIHDEYMLPSSLGMTFEPVSPTVVETEELTLSEKPAAKSKPWLNLLHKFKKSMTRPFKKSEALSSQSRLGRLFKAH